MALAEVDLKACYSRGKKPSRQQKLERKAEAINRDKGIISESQWVEDAPFYLDGILAFQATLTEEEKETLHLSLQE